MSKSSTSVCAIAMALTAFTLSPRPAAAQQSNAAERGAFIARIGKDTLAVESFTRTAQQLTGRSVLRSRVVTIRDYIMDFAPDGKVQRYEIRTYPLKSYRTVVNAGKTTYAVADPVADTVPGTVQTFEYVGDSVRITQQQGKNAPRTVMAPAAGRPLPFSENTFGVWQETVRRIGNGNEAAFLTGRSLLKYGVARPAAGRIVLDGGVSNDFGPMLINVDAQGRMTQLDMRATTDKYLVDRVASVNLDALMAQFVAHPLGSLSPRDTVRASIGGANIAIDHSKPSVRGRKVFGTGGMQPWGVVWRAGADAATQLITDRDLEIGGRSVPAGTYTLFVIPAETGKWTVVINKQHGQWGTVYDEKQDLARIQVDATPTESLVEQMKFSIDPVAVKSASGSSLGAGGFIRLAWENTALAIPFVVK